MEDVMLKYDSKIASVSVGVSKDKKEVAIFFQSGDSSLPRTIGFVKIAEFDICIVWDMIRDAVATADCSLSRSPGLFRRKGEAAAGILHTNRLFMERQERGLTNEAVMMGSQLEWIATVLNGGEVSEFALSFPVVRVTQDMIDKLDKKEEL